MKFVDYDRLLSIKKFGSLSKAADELYISRSALSQQVGQLEKELGFAILEKDYKGSRMTKEGICFLEKVQELKASYEEIIRQCRQSQHNTPDTLVIGLMPYGKSAFLTEICEEFHKFYPAVDIQFREFLPCDFAGQFHAKNFDISAEYFYNYHYDDRILKRLKIAETSFSLEAAPGHPLLKKEKVGFEELAGCRLIMYRKGINKNEDFLRERLVEQVPGITIVDIDHYDDSLYTVCKLTGALLLSYSLYSQIGFPQFEHIATNWDIPVELGFCYHKDCRPVVGDFIAMAERMFSGGHDK